MAPYANSHSLQLVETYLTKNGLPNFDTAWATLGGLPSGETMRKVLHEENMIELAGEIAWRNFRLCKD